jgi:hypothetical protein
MRSKLSIALSLVVLALASGVFLSTGASGQTVLHVASGPSHDFKGAFIDIGHNGLRLGDRIAARGPVLDETRTDRVGTLYQQCLVHKNITSGTTGLWNCNYILEFADGDLVLQGLDPRGPGAYEIAVLSGTGTYAGATGDATFTDVGTDDDAYMDMVIRLHG